MEGAIKYISIISSKEPSTHQHFVDDTMLYGESLVNEALSFKSILNKYIEASRHSLTKKNKKSSSLMLILT